MTNAPSVMPGQMTAIKPITTASAPRQASVDLETIRTGALPLRNARMTMTALLPTTPEISIRLRCAVGEPALPDDRGQDAAQAGQADDDPGHVVVDHAALEAAGGRGDPGGRPGPAQPGQAA